MRFPRASSVVAVAVCAALAGCRAEVQPPKPGGSSSSRAESARKLAEANALKAVTEVASKQAQLVPEVAVSNPSAVSKALSKAVSVITGTPVTVKPPPPIVVPPAAMSAKDPLAPRSAPRPGSPVLIRERVCSSLPWPTAKEAEEDALERAREVIDQKLRELDPPVSHLPSQGEVWTEFVRTDSRTVRPLSPEEVAVHESYGNHAPRVYVEYDIEITTDQVRELRSQNRVGVALRVLVALTGAALAAYLFLRADERTKGYLTRWLALVAAGIAGGVAAVMYAL
jgi:hypothetical protein